VSNDPPIELSRHREQDRGDLHQCVGCAAFGGQVLQETRPLVGPWAVAVLGQNGLPLVDAVEHGRTSFEGACGRSQDHEDRIITQEVLNGFGFREGAWQLLREALA